MYTVTLNKCNSLAKRMPKKMNKRRKIIVPFGLLLVRFCLPLPLQPWKEEALSHEEDKVNKYRVLAMDAEDDGNQRKRRKYYEDLADHHGNRVAEYLEEIALMKSNKE
jgi:hypothetical protein